MPRNENGVFERIPGTEAVPDTTISSAAYNETVLDFAADANAARPVLAGGTGATTAEGARANLFGQVALAQADGGTGATSLSAATVTSTGGSTARPLADKLGDFVSVKDFGATGGGTTDDRAAFVAALASGKAVFVPPTDAHYRLSAGIAVTTAGQTIFGFGSKSKIVIDDMTTAVNMISVDADDVALENLHLVPTNTANQGAYFNYAIAVTPGSKGVTISGCELSGHRGGVFVRNGENIKIINNYFHDSVIDVSTTATAATNAKYDVYINGTAKNVTISGNTIQNSAGTAIGLQTLSNDASERIENVAITQNIIERVPQYGIMIYIADGKNEENPDYIDQISIVGNVIKDVWGNVTDSEGDKIWGAGIYLQGGGAIVSGNTVINANVYTDTERVGYASITATNIRSYNISNNVIRDANREAIAVTDTNDQGVSGAGAVISGNIITTPTRSGIHIKDTSSVVCVGNHVSNGSSHGVFVQDSTSLTVKQEDIVIASNIVRGCNGTGVWVQRGDRAIIANNVAHECGVHGFSFGECAGKVIGNIASDNTNRGFSVDAAASVSLSFNDASGNGTNYVLGSQTRFVENTYSAPVSSNFGGVFGAVSRVLPADDATPSVINGQQFTTANTVATSITDLDDGYEGQRVTIRVEDNNTTFVHASGTLELAGSVNFAAGSGDLIEFVNYDGTRWVEVSRREA